MTHSCAKSWSLIIQETINDDPPIVVTSSTHSTSFLVWFLLFLYSACLSYLKGVFGILKKRQLTNKWPYEDSVLLAYDTVTLGIRFSLFRKVGNRLSGDAAT